MAKRQLTVAATVPFAMRDAYVADGHAHHLDFALERAWVELRWAPLFERVVIAIWDALRRAGWRPEQVDQVALIGGGALVPMFQRTVAGVFPGRSVVVPPRADVAVALGTVLLHGAVRRGSPRDAGARPDAQCSDRRDAAATSLPLSQPPRRGREPDLYWSVYGISGPVTRLPAGVRRPPSPARLHLDVAACSRSSAR